MNSKFLLPNKFKLPGWLILIPSAILGVFVVIDKPLFSITAPVFAIYSDQIFGKAEVFAFIRTDITISLVGILFTVGAMFVAFSKEKVEDEYIANIRQTSLLWAVFVNYALLLLELLFIYGTPFFSIMVYNMFTVLIIFIARFHFVLYRNYKTSGQ